MKNALRAWPSLRKTFKGYEHVALFLDYDGTLAPIKSRPEQAIMPTKVKGLIETLEAKKKFIVCVISGRSLKDLKKRTGIDGIIYAGNHGLEMEGPWLRFSSKKAQESRTLIKRIYKKLHTRLKSIAGCFVEDKDLSLAFHYRLARKEDIPAGKRLFEEVVRPYLQKRKAKITTGKKVLEVRPFVKWDKGRAVTWLLRKYMAYLQTSDVKPIYLGDDWTDESAFFALRQNGVPIFVGNPSSTTLARFFLRSPKEVKEFLGRLAETSS
jgi:trehalose-phosphatase